MADTTTPPAESGDDQQPQDNWAERYSGLQRVLAKRDTELTTANADRASLQEERDRLNAELATYRQRDVDASEEEQARQSYEALRARFEQAPPKPIGNNAAREWSDGSGDRNWRGRPHEGDGRGFPV